MIHRQHPERRELLKTSGLGLIAAAFGRPLASFAAPAIDRRKRRPLYQKAGQHGTVSLVKGSDWRENIFRSLQLIENDVLSGVGNRQILIKPNFVQTSRQLAATHADAIRAILDFLRPHYKREILIGESTAQKEGTFAGYKNYGYLALEKEYNVRLIDLNAGPWQHRYVIDEKSAPQAIRIAAPLLDPKVYVISAALAKTHGYVVVTLSLKNVLLGAPINDSTRSDKGLMHKGPHSDYNDLCHYNMFHLAQEVYPDLAVIDGFEGMEGDGPSRGTPVDSRFAIASVDALAADSLGARVMGYDPKKILYLASMAEAGMGQGDLQQVSVVGARVEDCLQHFTPSPMLKFSAVQEPETQVR